MVAQKKSIAEELVVTGSFAAGANVQVAPLVSGLAVMELLAEEGDDVKEGQVLARLDSSDIDIQLIQNAASLARNDADINQAKNQIEQAKINRDRALSDLNRTKKLRSTGVSTVEQFDQRQAAYDLAASQLDAAELSLLSARADRLSIEASKKELDLRKSRTEIKAPVDGYISNRLVEYGMISNPGGGAMFDLVAKAVVKLVAEVPESDLPKVKVGQKASIAVNGYAKALE
ncbi:MAG: efflux RND transporter periplasmic adaptor subunit, partial [Aestuariivirga sp.]